jgi:ferredoxin-NADP reductase
MRPFRRHSPQPPPDPPRPRHVIDDIAVESFTAPLPVSRGAPERKLRRVDRYDRRAQVTAVETLTSTGTVLITLAVIDDAPFNFSPGHFVGIRAAESGATTRRSPYCISSPPGNKRSFRLLVRLVPEGPVSLYLGGLGVGDVIAFRGPSGRSMIPKDDSSELVLLATGVGIGPFLSLLPFILSDGFARPVRLFWGLRQAEDICLTDELDTLAGRHDNFDYRVSLSQPPPDWSGLRGRLTQSVPPLLETLGDKHYYLVGNGAMINEMCTALSDLGVDEQLTHKEAYFNVRYRAEEWELELIRERFVASDLFSPYRHQQAGLFLPEKAAPRTEPGASGR